MKKYLLSTVVILAFIYYSLATRPEQIPPTIPIAAPDPNPTNPSPARTTLISIPAVTNTPSNGKYKNGTYTGNVSDAYYGNIQVAAVIEGGKLTKINILQYPNDRDRSIAINTYALPILQSEAIQAQNASVDMVSGATDTSQAFIESLTSALRTAKN